MISPELWPPDSKRRMTISWSSRPRSPSSECAHITFYLLLVQPRWVISRESGSSVYQNSRALYGQQVVSVLQHKNTLQILWRIPFIRLLSRSQLGRLLLRLMAVWMHVVCLLTGHRLRFPHYAVSSSLTPKHGQSS